MPRRHISQQAAGTKNLEKILYFKIFRNLEKIFYMGSYGNLDLVKFSSQGGSNIADFFVESDPAALT